MKIRGWADRTVEAAYVPAVHATSSVFAVLGAEPACEHTHSAWPVVFENLPSVHAEHVEEQVSPAFVTGSTPAEL